VKIRRAEIISKQEILDAYINDEKATFPNELLPKKMAILF